MVVVIDDHFRLPVTSGAVGVMEGRQFPLVMLCADCTTLWRVLRLRALQVQYQAVIQPEKMLSIVHL